jgi:segregation and condensation protein A
MLKISAENQEQKFPRSDNIIAGLKPDMEPELDIDQLSIWDLLGAFDLLMKATGSLMDISHITDDTPIDLYQIEVLHRLQTEGPMNFVRIFKDKKNKLVMIGLFLAVLELVREKLITAEQVPKGQAEVNMPIYLRALTDEPAEQAVHNAIMTQIERESETGDDYQQHNAIPIKTVEENHVPDKPPVPIQEIAPQVTADVPLYVEEKQALGDENSN